MKKSLCLAVLVFAAISSFAQAPASLPGYQVSLAAGYSLLTGAQNNNGFFSSVAAPLYLLNKKYSVSIAGRGDYFSIATPSSYVVAGGPEFRFQFSSATFFSGRVFQPYANVGGGMAHSSSNSTIYPAWKVGGGLDLVGNSTLSYRLLEVDYIHSTIFPSNHVVLQNFAQVMTGLKLSF